MPIPSCGNSNSRRPSSTEAAVNQDAGRASNDNLLDIIDIVQGDTNLLNMANQGGVHGFTPFGDALKATPKYLDNASQTTFWADFIAESNALGQQAVNTVGSHDAQAIASLISNLQTFEKNVTNFDAAQGGIFEARFDNELLGKTSTLGAEVSAMIKGLQTGNAALVAAAADEMHANAADVSGNNIPATGGTFNPDGLTVADALSTAVAAPAAVAAAPAAQTVATTAPASAAPAAPVATADAASPATAGTARNRRASFALRRNGAALSPHVGITADQRGFQRPVVTMGRWRSVGWFTPASGPAVRTINMSRRGSRKTREIVRSPGSANPEVGTGRLCKSNNGFLRRIAQATMQGRATRCGAPCAWRI